MATTNVGFSKPDGNEQPGNVLTWIATVLACAYIVWIGAGLYFSTPAFINMYASMGVELHLSTKVVIGFYRLGYPFLFGSAVVLLIGKQFSVHRKWPNLSITLGTVVVVDIIGSWIVRALYRPLFDMTEKLSK